LRLLAGYGACIASGEAAAVHAYQRELVSPHIGSQAQTRALHPLKQVL
jgi:hypothetical protein